MRPLTPLPAVVISIGLLTPASSLSQCLLDGVYVSTPVASYTCAFGFVDWDVQGWEFTISGNVVAVEPSPPGTLPSQLNGTIDCQTGAFSASASIFAGPGGCSETYTLSGQVLSIASWSGSFQAQYVGSGCSFAGCGPVGIAVSGALAPTGVRPGSGAPGLARMDVGPNPFGTTTTMRVQLESRQSVQLLVHDVTGRVVATLAAGEWLESGEYRYSWDRRTRDGGRAATGIYFVRLRTNLSDRVAKLVVLD
jgi:hypothetical protein